ncbi:NlpC/P60 family protein [Anaerovorax odorimutans]|uniref:NlpC/P60 family protein n=1 Tax=Anaerovorax odorimutans TaxID=109327 RepID=A0ABT1RR57_9FIRM|nr:NlpC/P60 family protein [Anaerovorax odorimutans]MCQ4637667.1 NlpC/P60 family protein [Anaerovorax odorimutans]
MRLTWENSNISEYISSVTWSGSAKQASRQISFSIASNQQDSGFKNIPIKTGDVIRLYDDVGSRVFLGRVTNREQKSDIGTVSYTAKDYMDNLLRSKGTYKFKNKTPEKIARTVCKDIKMSTGSIAKTKIKIKKLFAQEKEYYNIILMAYTKAHKKNGKKYMLRMNGTKLEVIEKGKVIPSFHIVQGERIIDSTYTESSESMVNRVAIYNQKHKKIGTISNKTWVSRYGVLQDTLTVEKGKGKTEAKKMLQGLEKTYTLNCLGDSRCIAGKGVIIRDGATGLSGTFWIENDTHTWENDTYTMALEMTFKNVMETVDEDEGSTSPGSGGSSTVKTDVLNGKTVSAVFTAYYPANNKMEGGFYDAQGHKLDPKKYTCAAPKSIAFGTQIQVVGTGTSFDKKVYKVTDRGGAITIKNGVYHFDLLMESKAKCNKFGRRKGKAIIGNGTGYKTKTVTTGASGKVGKVIDKAKSYIGKVKYVFGAASPDSGRSDCSGFTQHVFRKAVGINIGRTTLEQVKKGTKVSKANLQPGDLVMFQGTYRAGVSHVGIYIGNSKFVHCGSSHGVTTGSLKESYWVQHWHSGRRIL